MRYTGSAGSISSRSGGGDFRNLFDNFDFQDSKINNIPDSGQIAIQSLHHFVADTRTVRHTERQSCRPTLAVFPNHSFLQPYTTPRLVATIMKSLNFKLANCQNFVPVS